MISRMFSIVPRPWLFALPLGVMVAACNTHDHDASLAGPERPLAVGAYHRVAFGDACVHEFDKFFPNFCSTELVTDVLESRSDDPAIANVVLGTDHPQGSLAKNKFYVVGQAVGQTSLVFKGTFDDGSVRESSLVVRVEAVDTFRFADCGQPPSTNLLVRAGDTEGFEVQMFAGKQQLAGWLPGAVSADGLTEQFNDGDTMPYVWQGSPTPAVANVQSPIVSNVGLTLTAFGAEQVTSIELIASSAAFTAPGNFYFGTQVRVHGQTPCRALPVEVHSATPSICWGPSGETVWQVATGTGNYAVAHAEGNCVLGVAVPGGEILNTGTFPIYFVQPEPPSDPPPTSDFCPVEGATICTGDNHFVSSCKARSLTTKSTCSSDQICDYVPDSTPGCVAGTSCARCRGLR